MLLWYTSENVGLVQEDDYVCVLSKCCGARFDAEKCTVCSSAFPKIEVADPETSSPCELGPLIRLSETTGAERFVWWARAWTELELEIEVRWP